MGREPAAEKLADALALNPVIHAQMALGEGTGAVMMLSLLDIALCVYQKQLTFSDMGLERYERFDQS
jgi:nicotinate-nucleotide--dimethylbenzimidazole phosphoribosyltransferase